MTSRDFAYWLQGFAELNTLPPTADQWVTIRRHLDLVFKHEIDPSMPDPTGVLQATHDGLGPAGPIVQGRPPGSTTYRC